MLLIFCSRQARALGKDGFDQMLRLLDRRDRGQDLVGRGPRKISLKVPREEAWINVAILEMDGDAAFTVNDDRWDKHDPKGRAQTRR